MPTISRITAHDQQNTQLFRHPLGIPFPHTAILPKNRDRLAKRLSLFLRTQFLQEEALVQLLRKHAPSRAFVQWLGKRRNRDWLISAVQRSLLQLLRLVDLQGLREALSSSVTRELQGMDLSGLAGKLLTEVTRDGRHQNLLSDALGKADDWLDQEEVQNAFSAQIEQLLLASYPKLFSWIGAVVKRETFCSSIAGSLVQGAKKLLGEIRDDPEHPKRQAFDAWVKEWANRLRNDEQVQEQMAGWRDEWLQDPVFRGYLGQLAEDLRSWAIGDLEKTDSAIARNLRRVITGTLRLLRKNVEVRRAMDQWAEDLLRSLVPNLQDTFCQHVEDQIRSWPLPEMIRLLEEGIGTDLQYIRVNGAVVGALAGIGIHAISLLIPVGWA